jgi:hypothetical protein
VFADVTDNMTICREEIFGPVMSIIKFSDIHEVSAPHSSKYVKYVKELTFSPHSSWWARPRRW